MYTPVFNEQIDCTLPLFYAKQSTIGIQHLCRGKGGGGGGLSQVVN